MTNAAPAQTHVAPSPPYAAPDQQVSYEPQMTYDAPAQQMTYVAPAQQTPIAPVQQVSDAP